MQLWDCSSLVLFKSKWLFQWESAKDFRSRCCDHPACRARGWGGTHHPPRSYLSQSTWHRLLDLQQPTERERVGDRPPRSSAGKPEVWGSKPKVCCQFLYRKSDLSAKLSVHFSFTVSLSLVSLEVLSPDLILFHFQMLFEQGNWQNWSPAFLQQVLQQTEEEHW